MATCATYFNEEFVQAAKVWLPTVVSRVSLRNTSQLKIVDLFSTNSESIGFIHNETDFKSDLKRKKKQKSQTHNEVAPITKKLRKPRITKNSSDKLSITDEYETKTESNDKLIMEVKTDSLISQFNNWWFDGGKKIYANTPIDLNHLASGHSHQIAKLNIMFQQKKVKFIHMIYYLTKCPGGRAVGNDTTCKNLIKRKGEHFPIPAFLQSKKDSISHEGFFKQIEYCFANMWLHVSYKKHNINELVRLADLEESNPSLNKTIRVELAGVCYRIFNKLPTQDPDFVQMLQKFIAMVFSEYQVL